MPRIPPPSPWKAFGEPDADFEYLVVLTHLPVPVRKLSALPKFFKYVGKIRGQLESGPEGLAGYSLRAQPFSSNYGTLSAWESAAAMGRFMREDPHREAAAELPKMISHFQAWRWKSAGNALPQIGARP